jgi:tetratricopeptide (TPR) repeat protein/transcriptional regulator with XRE-family HTH domain
MTGSDESSFADVLRSHRHGARLTLEQLAEASGVSARTLSDMERGRSRGPQHRTVSALADALALGGADRKLFLNLARDGRLRDHWSRPVGLCELPRSVDDFTGRVAEMAWTNDLVEVGDAPGVAGVGIITGSAGLGKTTLAVRAAHVLRPSFPDGVFFVDLFGMSPRPLGAEEALGLLLRAWGVSDQQLPGDVTERASVYRSLLRDKRALVVLDNAASEEQIRPLLPGDGTGRVLVTSRRLLAGLSGVRRLGLGPLSLPDSTELLAEILGERSSSDGQQSLTRLAQLCGGLPLALRIIGNRLVSRPDWSADELVARLADEERRLNQLKAGDLEIATAFGLSYQQLAPSTRELFRRLAVIPGRDFDAAVVAAQGGTSSDAAWDALDELVDLGLLQDAASGRYRFHDLVRLFARERLQAEDDAATREALTAAVTSWLLRMATTAGRWFEPAYGRPERTEPDLVPLTSPDEAERWLRVNVDNWLGALRLASERGLQVEVLDCVESMHWFSDHWLYGPPWKDIFALGARAAAGVGDVAREAAQLNNLAWVHVIPPDDPVAVLHYAAQARQLAIRSGAREQVAWADQHSGGALRRLGRLSDAAESVGRAAEVFQDLGNVDAYCQCLSVLGQCLRDDGRYAEAVEQFRRIAAVSADPESGMTPGVASLTLSHALGLAGQSLALLGRRAEAIATLTEAVEHMEGWQSPNHKLGRVLEILAGELTREGRTDDSRRAYLRAAEVFTEIGNADAAQQCREQAAAV